MVDYFVDANVWAWYFNKNSKNHTKIVKFLTPLILDESNTIYINPFVLIETFNYFIKFLGPVDGETSALGLLSSNFIIILSLDINDSYFTDIFQILKQYGVHTTIGGRDSTIIHSMKKAKIQKIITNDKGFENVNKIEVINPLKS